VIPPMFQGQRLTLRRALNVVLSGPSQAALKTCRKCEQEGHNRPTATRPDWAEAPHFAPRDAASIQALHRIPAGAPARSSPGFLQNSLGEAVRAGLPVRRTGPELVFRWSG
jgi:hypothetical protein